MTPGTRKRAVNDLMRDGLRNLPREDRIAFFCECGDESCYQAVWLTGVEYDRARAEEEWAALFPGHADEGQAAGRAHAVRT